MAGFGFFKPQQTSVRPGDLPKFGDLSAQEKLMMLGATLRGDMQAAQAIPMMAAARAKQAAEKEWRSALTNDLQGVPMQRAAPVRNEEGSDISAAFSPKTETVQGPRPTLRDLVPKLMEGRNRGYDIKSEIELLKAVDPDIKYERGMRYDARDPASAPREIIDVEKGQQRVFDANGNVIGVMNAKGYVQSVAELEGAKTEASERAKAKYDIGKYDMPDGSTQQAIRLKAAEAFGGLDGVPMLGGTRPGVPSPPLPPNPRGADDQPALYAAPAGSAGFGRSQTPAEKALAEGRAANRVKAEGMDSEAATQAAIDLPRNRATAEQTLKVINDLRKHPGRQFGTGMTGVLPPMPGSETKDFVTMLKQAQGKTFLEAFASLKGGGAITEREGQAATEAIARLDRQQSEEGFMRALADLEDVVKGAMARSSAKAARSPIAQTGRITPEQARAELARRRAAAANQ